MSSCVDESGVKSLAPIVCSTAFATESRLASMGAAGAAA